MYILTCTLCVEICVPVFWYQMRWRFTDFTHKKNHKENLVADVLSLCEIDSTGPIYLIHLEDHTQGEPFDVGKILITLAKVKKVDYTYMFEYMYMCLVA